MGSSLTQGPFWGPVLKLEPWPETLPRPGIGFGVLSLGDFGARGFRGLGFRGFRAEGIEPSEIKTKKPCSWGDQR